EDNTGTKVITALASKTDGLFSTSGSLLDPILEIIAKYSPDINAKMVTTASNDPLFTFDPHSSQSRIVNSINKLKHRNQTIDNTSVEGAVKHLQHLSTRNPFNGWQNALVSSLFDSTGKRNNNTLVSGLLMGVEKIEDTKHIDGQKSTKLSKEDKYLEDLHLMLRRGTPAMMRYGTKGKETFVGVKDLGLGNDDKFLYIDLKKFTDENLSEANTEFVKRMIGWLDAELVRVLEFNKADTPYKNVYKTYYKNGKDFYLFNGMLSKSTIKKIKDYYNIEEGKTSTDDLVLLSQTSLHDEKLSEIRNDIYNDLSYFMEMAVAEDMKLFNKRPYIDTNLSARIANASKETNKDKQKVIAVRAHTYNYMLRNLDMMGLL
ncbi:MAG: hypothetical protein KDH96_13085, partial [Candidatus Riesia sp.]|nr:hypothetical protein [Candidatus Riesia sp.]